ncbi:DUF397 domain-containing protein [Streptomyces paludis]|uniref:DUF397 domain-containing protein n=1 Tax=Streptomyces paludis TaxID=2282738 RepID=A0A345HUJ3_9ACTN|nr:DUF397 domain-containing protein [Streptomyces paludis]AXG80367.1 DUF397 domain-containing protein [Streptomyces paludis]
MTGAGWFKSSYSNAQGNECLEGAYLDRGAIAVRDSKRPEGPAFVFAAPAWAAFVGGIDALAGGAHP